jgi:hypothetical protein
MGCSQSLLCSSKLRWGRERISSKFVDNLDTHAEKGLLAPSEHFFQFRPPEVLPATRVTSYLVTRWHPLWWWIIEDCLVLVVISYTLACFVSYDLILFRPYLEYSMKFNMNDVLNSRAWIWLFAILNTSCVYIHLLLVYMRFSYIITMRIYSCTCTRHGGLAAVEVQLHWFLTSTLEGQELSPSLLVCLLPGKFLLGTLCVWGWVSLRAGLDVSDHRKSLTLPDSNPACSPVTIPTELWMLWNCM